MPKKVAVVLNDELLEALEEYRVEIYRQTGTIPKMSVALRDLLAKALGIEEG